VHEIRFACPRCKAQVVAAISGEGAVPRCEACGAEHTLRFSESLRERRIADRCALCGSEHFYVQRDFDQRWGCLIVAIGAAFVPWTYGLSLAVCALIDLVLYRRLRSVAKCYVCKATYRGGEMHPDHKPFDLHLLEKYEAEARRAAAGRTAGSETGGSHDR
jgi:hypothetical protein